MTDRPIIYSAPMVRALLDGRKTQTRRLATSPLRKCEVGDRLWVREGFFVMSDDYGWSDYASRQGCQPDRTIGYHVDQSDGPMVDDRDWLPPVNAKRTVHGLKGGDDRDAWTMIGPIPSIYMPRWASRLTLIVEGVRVEPVQAISREDAIAEGIEPFEQDGVTFYPDYLDVEEAWEDPRQSYKTLWQKLHGFDAWRDNPDVLVLTFRVEHGNIDRIAA